MCNHLTLRLISFCHWLRGLAHLSTSACKRVRSCLLLTPAIAPGSHRDTDRSLGNLFPDQRKICVAAANSTSPAGTLNRFLLLMREAAHTPPPIFSAGVASRRCLEQEPARRMGAILWSQVDQLQQVPVKWIQSELQTRSLWRRQATTSAKQLVEIPAGNPDRHAGAASAHAAYRTQRCGAAARVGAACASFRGVQSRSAARVPSRASVCGRLKI